MMNELSLRDQVGYGQPVLVILSGIFLNLRKELNILTRNVQQRLY